MRQDVRALLVSLLDQLSLASRGQRALRLLVAAATLAFVGLVEQAGTSFTLGSVLLVLVGLSLVLVPDGNAALVWMLLAVWAWALAVPGEPTWWTLAASADLLVVHVACLLACYGPAQLALPARLVRLWAGRSAVLLAVTALAWLFARLLAGLDLPVSGGAYGAGLLLVAVWAAFLMHRLTARDGS